MKCVPLCFAAVCSIVACAVAEQKADEQNGRPDIASSGRGGTSTAGRTGAGGTPASAGSTARGGSTSGGSGGSGDSGGAESGGGGSGGSDDSVGNAGDGDGGSEGGAGSTTPGAGECAESPTARVQYKVFRSDSVIQFHLRFYNEGATALALSNYEFDYYFSNEEDSAWNTHVDDASTAGGADGYIALQGATTVTVEPLAPSAVGATHVLRITIDSPTPLEAADVGLLSIRLEPTSYEPPHQAQADDHSFDAAKTDYSDWDRIAVLAQGDLAWGCVP